MESHDQLFDIIGKRVRWYILSAIILIPGTIALVVWGLNVGIDFKGGTLQQLHFTGERPAIESIRQGVEQAGVNAVSVQTSGSQDILIRFANEEGKQARDQGNAIRTKLSENHGEVSELAFESIGGSVAKATTRKAAWAIVLTALALIVYIAASFGSVPKPASSWRFGVSAILALAHDILFVFGMFAILGRFIPSVEVDSLFITAILTILGFSVNDTIVVFDRIRENLRRNPGRPFAEVANVSVNQTLARSINTSMTVVIVLVSLLLLGGASIRNFILALTLGVVTGTYSSIFNATPLLVSWQGFVDSRQGKRQGAANQSRAGKRVGERRPAAL